MEKCKYSSKSYEASTLLDSCPLVGAACSCIVFCMSSGIKAQLTRDWMHLRQNVLLTKDVGNSYVIIEKEGSSSHALNRPCKFEHCRTLLELNTITAISTSILGSHTYINNYRKTSALSSTFKKTLISSTQTYHHCQHKASGEELKIGAVL